MQELIENRTYIVELTPVKQRAEKLRERLDAFARKYHRIVDSGHCVSIPDNPMGNLAFQGPELIDYFSLPVPRGRVLCHLNTFHTIDGIHSILGRCKKLGIDRMLIISGDGGERLPKLHPQEVDTETASVTAVELIRYVKRTYDGSFQLGVAFNQYEEQGHEFDKLERKLNAGAEFIITQPVVGREEVIDRLLEYDVPVFLEAWMSKNTVLLADCIGYDIPSDYEHKPLETLAYLVDKFSQCGFYTALLRFKTQFPVIEEIWTRGTHE